MGPFFAQNWYQRRVLWPEIGDFSRFVFTDKYTGAMTLSVCFVSLTLLDDPQKVGLKDRGGGIFLFSSDCFSL
jgi:hypothetical protein